MDKQKLTSDELLEFLLQLDNATHINLTGWEAKFIESNLNNPMSKFGGFTEKQRQVIYQMMDKYDHLI